MIVTLEIPAATRRKIDRDEKLARRSGRAFAEAMKTAIGIGAEEIKERLSMGDLGLTMQRPGQEGLAGGLSGWMLDPAAPVGAIGVPANHPASRYAHIHETGGTIRPKNAKALAVPISKEARDSGGPREMEGLDLIPRKGKPSLLVRKLGARGARRAQWQIHWVLLASVTIPATHWLTRGAEAARPAIRDAFADRFGEYLEQW